MENSFDQDILEGLSSIPKYLSSKYFYDKKGDEIFQQIMAMPEYYPTNCELEIFETHKESIRNLFGENCKSHDLIEFGAGDGMKTKILLKHFLDHKTWFKYYPIDISENVIEQLSRDLKDNFHCINFNGQVGDYFEKLETLSDASRCRKVILFLGSNIGNFSESEAVDFISKIRTHMNPKDYLMIGFDLKKDPNVILNAYHDPHGITKSFNLNLLQRINSELDADFNVEGFEHFPYYNPQTGECRSFLVSKTDQSVYVKALEKTFHFDAWESIDMEISQKYDPNYIQLLAQKSGMKIVRNFYDSRKYFVDSVWAIE